MRVNALGERSVPCSIECGSGETWVRRLVAVSFSLRWMATFTPSEVAVEIIEESSEGSNTGKDLEALSGAERDRRLRKG